IVFHCAGSVRGKTEEELFSINVTGTYNICQACYNRNVKRLIYLSSIATVNGNSQMPLADNMPYKARNAYGRSKIEAEKIAIEFREKGLPVAIIRPCMVYGEGEPHALYKIFRAAQKRLIPAIRGSEMDSKLNLVDVNNVVSALALALEKEEALSGTFIIADKDAITIRKFLEIVYNELDVGGPPVFPAWMVKFCLVLPPVKRKFKGLFKDRVYDISRAEKLLGYSPAISTEEGLRRVIRDWKGRK
ncbi:MAG: NAD-dependent epimerase/dehydratase family protein, partial [Candidatus Omnitrophica bacterium]|nr:NAD-dependent epimerase/dehydratase family protein [Candidatus Omnitrophota bacterium]